MKIHTYLTFDGQCEAAFNYYAECLGGSLELMRMGESPEAGNVPEQFHDRVMHVCLTVGDQLLMASDTFPGMPYEGIKGSSVSLQVENVPEAERLYKALSAGAFGADGVAGDLLGHALCHVHRPLRRELDDQLRY